MSCTKAPGRIIKLCMTTRISVHWTACRIRTDALTSLHRENCTHGFASITISSRASSIIAFVVCQLSQFFIQVQGLFWKTEIIRSVLKSYILNFHFKKSSFWPILFQSDSKCKLICQTIPKFLYYRPRSLSSRDAGVSHCQESDWLPDRISAVPRAGKPNGEERRVVL